ncbi:MAG TPA: hypothetical protein VJU84_10410 [Pyrinomonadaceae bacterium]|nr:hypothetical protein [Pyrinomonadaceae bacterium]
MQRLTAKQSLAYSLLIMTFTLSGALAKAQDRRAQPVSEWQLAAKAPCPRPISLTLTATTPNVVNSDFSAVQLGAPRAWLNDPAINKNFLYTFQYAKDERCCEVTSAVLTVRMKANQSGQSKTSADAGNDAISIMYNAGVVPPFSQPVYSSWSFNAGQTSTKTWTLTGSALANLNATRRLSIYVQDDTMVQSATLQISGCCLSTTREPLSISDQSQPQ